MFSKLNLTIPALCNMSGLMLLPQSGTDADTETVLILSSESAVYQTE